MMRNTTKDKIAMIFAGIANEIFAEQERTGLSREEVIATNPVLAGKVLVLSQIQSALLAEYN